MILRKVTQSIEKEIEIETPYFSKRGDGQYFRIDENGGIWVTQLEGCCAIEFGNNLEDAAFSVQCVPITEDEFNSAYNRVLGFITARNPSIKQPIQ